MANRKRTKNLRKSLKTVCEMNWIDDIHILPNNIDKKLLDECSELIQNFIDNESPLPTKPVQSKSKSQKRPITKSKKSKIKTTTKTPKLKSHHKQSKTIKFKGKSQQKKVPPSIHYSPMLSTNASPCYPSAFPCYRSCGPINCPKNKLPMPRDLWYRIVYSQALEQQLVSSAKRKQKEVEDEDESSSLYDLHSNNPRRQQTMNAAFSSSIITASKVLKLDELQNPIDIAKQETLSFVPSNSHKSYLINQLEYIPETLPLEIEPDPEQSNIAERETYTSLWTGAPDETVVSTQSAHTELIKHPKVHRDLSADAVLEHNQPTMDELLPSPPLVSKQSTTILPIENLLETSSSVIYDHPIYNQLIEYYHLQDISQTELFKRLNRRLTHIRQTLASMSTNDIEIKLKYKRDALTGKRQTPIEALTKDERIFMAELELNVYEYVQALNDASLKCYSINIPVQGSVISLQSSMPPSMSTFNTVQPSAVSQSAALLSTTATQLTDKTDKFISWDHPLLLNLMTMFEHSTPLRKAQIQKQLARRYEHICKKAKECNTKHLQTQINTKSTALLQHKNILKPNEDECLRIAELELCVFELEREQTQRNQ